MKEEAYLNECEWMNVVKCIQWNVLCTRKMFILNVKSAQKLRTICINVWTLMSIFSCNGHANSCNLMHVRTVTWTVKFIPRKCGQFDKSVDNFVHTFCQIRKQCFTWTVNSFPESVDNLIKVWTNCPHLKGNGKQYTWTVYVNSIRKQYSYWPESADNFI